MLNMLNFSGSFVKYTWEQLQWNSKQAFHFCKLCLNIFTPSSNYVCLGPNSLSSYIDMTEIAGWEQTPKWDNFLPLIGCTSQDKIHNFQLTYLSLLSLLGVRHWSSYLGLHIISVSKLRKIFTGLTYRLFLSFIVILDVYRSFIPNKTTLTKYLLTQWISLSKAISTR